MVQIVTVWLVQNETPPGDLRGSVCRWTDSQDDFQAEAFAVDACKVLHAVRRAGTHRMLSGINSNERPHKVLHSVFLCCPSVFDEPTTGLLTSFMRRTLPENSSILDHITDSWMKDPKVLKQRATQVDRVLGQVRPS